ncbi:MAG: hypothetical protein L0191_13195 [Acidobacteria bacterium]|nr:hypothetical protein [Acidobacteriota bacterium]
MTLSSWCKGFSLPFSLALVLALESTLIPARAQECLEPGCVVTPTVPQELPTEVELELAPDSLKNAPLWHELAQLLEDPSAFDCPLPDDPLTVNANEGAECFATISRRQSFLYRDALGQPCAPGPADCVNVPYPPLKIWSPHFNVLTGQPMRLRPSDEEISWDQPGPLFGPQDLDPLSNDAGEPIGSLVVDAGNNLVVSNPDANPDLPAEGTIVAVPAFNTTGEIVDIDGNPITELEKPITELDFFRPETDTAGTAVALQPYIGRLAAEALGKALFWDMQVGSDGVQACGSCHFHATVDNRTKNQLNPNHLGGDFTLQVFSNRPNPQDNNQDLVASDYPFHKLANLNIPGEPLMNPGNVAADSNDVMSSMGVRFRKFGDIPTPGGGKRSAAFVQVGGSVRPLAPDCPVPDGVTPKPAHCQDLPSIDPGSETDPIPLFQGLRRVEPRNTATLFAIFNFDQFWDGRARHDSNGGSVFGPADPQLHVFINDGTASGALHGASNGDFRPDLLEEDPELAEQPVRIRFSSLASLATGPALSNFEMSFDGRNWAKLGKKLLQRGVVPLANQLVDPTDSVLGPFSGQRSTVNGAVNQLGRPGLNTTYNVLIRLAFRRELWRNSKQHLDGAPAPCTSALNGVLTPAGCDPFDGYVLSAPVAGAAAAADTNQFNQMEANMSLFFGQSFQAWAALLIPDDTPFDRFMDANPLAANGVAQPGEQGTLPPNEVAGLVCPGQPLESCLVFPDPDKFGPDELFGFDIFAGANLTAALPVGDSRNPAGHGSNPFHRTARCMICHLGPEQTDHTNNINAGLMQSSTEFEFPTPQFAAEPTGPMRLVTGISLAEEVEENAQDGVEVENRDFGILDDPNTVDFDEGQIGSPSAIAFQDNGVYNIGVRPTHEDIMRGNTDPFGWPMALAALALKNLAGPDFEPCDDPDDALAGCAMANFDPLLGVGGGLFEESGADQLINPGLEVQPAIPLLPEYLAPWANNLPAGEANPQIDELAFAPNTITEPPFAEFGEIFFGSDFNCGVFDPLAFGDGPPNFGWGPQCPNAQSAIPPNFAPPLNGTWPFPNRVARNGAVKVPQLRNVELTGPFFHTGSYLTLRQVIDFYMRGGDFPITNAEDRDPNLVDIGLQAFGFGTTVGLPPQFQDAIPDTIAQYDSMPDTDHASTPEPEDATPEEARVALVKYLLSLTDERVKFERAPFDHPEIFVPLDGFAPDNAPTIGFAGGRAAMLADPRFRQIPAVGAGGNLTQLPNFLGISSTPVGTNDDCASTAGLHCDHFDRM